MEDRNAEVSPLVVARVAGVLYLIIIALGLFGELGVRASLVDPGDPGATATNIRAAEGLFRAGFLADSIMFVCDVALAVLLYLLLRPVNRTLALIALCYRLTQTAVLALNLLHYHAAVLILDGPGYADAFGEPSRDQLVSMFLDLHSHGYDLGLILFGAHCLVLGYLIARSGILPKILGYLVVAAGMTYLIGSATRFLLPAALDAILPIYAIALVAELSLGLWLLIKGVRPVPPSGNRVPAGA